MAVTGIVRNDLRFTCERLIPVTGDICKIFLKPEQETIPYLPGQYVQVKLSADLYLPLSIANLPQNDGLLEFHLRHNSAHPLAQVFYQQVQDNREIRLKGPFGQFTRHRGFGKRWLFLAGGTGFAPIKAVLSDLFAQEKVPSVHLFWGVKDPQDCYEQDILAQWESAFGLTYDLVLSKPGRDPHWIGKTGWVHGALAETYPDLSHKCVFACGPYEMIKAAQKLFLRLGLAENAFISDVT